MRVSGGAYASNNEWLFGARANTRQLGCAERRPLILTLVR